MLDEHHMPEQDSIQDERHTRSFLQYAMLWKCWPPYKTKPFTIVGPRVKLIEAGDKHCWPRLIGNKKMLHIFNSLWPSSSGKASKRMWKAVSQLLLMISKATCFRGGDETGRCAPFWVCGR
jgi:hypothetical protein